MLGAWWCNYPSLSVWPANDIGSSVSRRTTIEAQSFAGKIPLSCNRVLAVARQFTVAPSDLDSLAHTLLTDWRGHR